MLSQTKEPRRTSLPATSPKLLLLRLFTSHTSHYLYVPLSFELADVIATGRSVLSRWRLQASRVVRAQRGPRIDPQSSATHKEPHWHRPLSLETNISARKCQSPAQITNMIPLTKPPNAGLLRRAGRMAYSAPVARRTTWLMTSLAIRSPKAAGPAASTSWSRPIPSWPTHASAIRSGPLRSS